MSQRIAFRDARLRARIHLYQRRQRPRLADQVRWLSIRFVGLRFLFIDVIDVIEVVVVQWGDGPS